MNCPNKYGEIASEDALTLAVRINSLIRRGGAEPSHGPLELARCILSYIDLRQSLLPHEIAFTPDGITKSTKSTQPVEWTAGHESVWREWIYYQWSLRDWQSYVIEPTFGSDVRYWETRCPGWRDELFGYLDQWILRSMATLDKIDPRHQDPVNSVTEEVDPLKAKIDPYLLEHGRKGRRIKGLKLAD